MSDPQVINHAALSALLTQTEAMLTIQRGKYDVLASELQEYHPINRSASRLFSNMTHLGNEISMLEDVAQQLRAAGVIPK